MELLAVDILLTGYIAENFPEFKVERIDGSEPAVVIHAPASINGVIDTFTVSQAPQIYIGNKGSKYEHPLKQHLYITFWGLSEYARFSTAYYNLSEEGIDWIDLLRKAVHRWAWSIRVEIEGGIVV